jgi:transcription factor IIIB subunit 2
MSLDLPYVDPSLYISRFAYELDFGDYTRRVVADAVRIVKRMDTDWIVSGRRPAGVCGACLLIAARMNGFRRTLSEMASVAKVAETTIQKR